MKPVIILKDLKMRYKEDGEDVLKGIDLTVYPGQIIGYIGPNGAGKSTTVKIMLGMVKQFRGEVRVLDYDIRKEDISYKKHIGYVPEIATLYDSLSGEEYLIFIGELYGLSKESVLAKSKEMYALFDMLPAFQNRISSYSKGMKQKLMIIASLIHNPDILFFDEPISGLDANSVMIFKALIKKLAEAGKTIFYSSHIMEVVEKISDRIIIIDQGQIIADGDFQTLKQNREEGSLQEIFSQLTGFHNHDDIASAFIDCMKA